ncbi:4-hydroxybenzoate polyprenyltransferase, mitochondrial [Galendromus occidentalis]|uniref:4-hydroxybenzoate polyprenyltransferase, mitochondrial n=1 Tax=Galendromus occidentalis TaxID=34638 RepID=A0AAJ6QR05_9ACAR|nr:4-hydroxybenzoate polyprenyltransferase, mitochondrial [Galendromus occidentalis]
MSVLQLSGLYRRASRVQLRVLSRWSCSFGRVGEDDAKSIRAKAKDIKTPRLEKFVLAMPRTFQPYLRLIRFERPVGTWLTLLPGLWSLTMATPAGQLPDLHLIALFGGGAFLMRGFGCTINDMWDKDIDKKVERTRARPLASGELSRWDALWFSAGQAGMACLILLQLNWESVQLGAASVGLVVLYPLMKRFTYWPQAFLAVVFNWGVLLGFSAVQASAMNWAAALPLYAAAFSWTMVYDTIYAHQDKHDDLMIGAKSTALKFGSRTPLWLGAFTTSMTTNLLLAGVNSGQTWPYYSAVALAAARILQQLYTLDTSNPEDCAKKFVSNKNVGLLIWGGCIAGTLLKTA